MRPRSHPRSRPAAPGARPARALAAVLVLAALCARSRALAQSCQTLSGLPYGSYLDAQGQTQELLLDLLLPQGAGAPAPPLPVVVWIHGGGWWSGSRLDLPDGVSALCGRGYAVAAVDYRLSTVARWPAQIQDVRGAVRWLRAHAAEYGLDPDRFGVWGMSAGAHLAAVLGTAGGVATGGTGGETVDLEGATGGNPGLSSRVQAVVDWYGESDFLRMLYYPGVDHDAASSPESRLLGAPLQSVPARAATADPIAYVSADDPPFLVMHGGIDQLVPFNQSELLVDALRRAGVPVTFSPLPNAGHAGSAFDRRRCGRWPTTSSTPCSGRGACPRCASRPPMPPLPRRAPGTGRTPPIPGS